jgi:outer membrane protein assembly factor BamB
MRRRNRLQFLLFALAVDVLSIAAPTGVTNEQGLAVPRPGFDPLASPIWHVVGEGWGMPAADDSTVYFLGQRHEVIAINAQDGGVRWRSSTGRAGGSTEGSLAILSGPVVAVGDYDLLGFDRLNGSLRWRFGPLTGYAPGVYLGSALDTTIFTGSVGYLHAIDHSTGNARWSVPVMPTDRTTVFQPVAAGETVVAGFTHTQAPLRGGVIAVDSRTGVEKWHTSFPISPNAAGPTNSAGGPVFFGNLVIAPSGDGYIHAFRLSTGAHEWSLPPVTGAISPNGPLLGLDFRPLTVVGRTLIAGSITGLLIAYQLDTRTERWRHNGTTNGSINHRLTNDQLAVYVPYLNGSIGAIHVETGKELWRMRNMAAGFFWAVLPYRERLYVGSGSGFYSLRATPVAPSRRPQL